MVDVPYCMAKSLPQQGLPGPESAGQDHCQVGDETRFSAVSPMQMDSIPQRLLFQLFLLTLAW
jgi:hypothetical protein